MSAAKEPRRDLDPAMLAAYAHVEVMLPTADAHSFGAPLWHGWALRNAFIAGVKYAEEAAAAKATGSAA